jgi:peptidoglycan/LPS O-acetylase OafA/YrhL
MRYFYIRRAKRILPLLVLIVTIESFFKHGFFLHNWYWYAFFLMNIRETIEPVGVLRNLWSLAIEEHFYLIWPALFFALDRKRAARFLIAILLVSPILRFIFTPLFRTPLPIYFLTPFRLDGLAAGSLLSILVHQNRLNYRPRLLMSLLLLCAPLSYAAVHFIPGFYREANSPIFNSIGYSLIVLIASTFVLLAYQSQGTILGNILSFKPLTFMGTISYFVYLFHSAIIHYLPIPTIGEKRAIGVCLTVLAGTVSWYLIEQPILRSRFWEQSHVEAIATMQASSEQRFRDKNTRAL